jgi:membrane protease YdiL (CAAX protease family)
LETCIVPTTEQDAPPRPVPKGLLPLWVFLSLSAALSWTVWLSPTSNKVIYVNFRGWRVNWPLSNIKLLIGNSLPGVLALVWASVQGKQHLRGLLSSIFNWRVQLRWYFLSIALPCGVFLSSLCAVLIYFPGKLSRPPALLVFTSLLSLPFGSVWEEIAWRAFALRKLQDRYSQLGSALIIGSYWAVWHIPLWLITLNYLTGKLLLITCINLISWSIIFAFLYNRSGQSLPVVILLHATYFTVQNLVFAAVSYGNIHLIPIAALLSVSLAAILAGRLAAGSDGPPFPTPRDYLCNRR